MLSRGRSSADQLIGVARRRTALDEFGETAFLGSLQNFLDACFEEANLGLVGRLATRWDIVRFLSHLLRLHDEELRAPEILDQPVTNPIFISGLPRSGTTFLHSLLAEDPANLVPRVWQTIHPYPLKRGPHRDSRAKRVARQLRLFALLAPNFRRMHPIDAASPQECSEITAHVFALAAIRTVYPDARLVLVHRDPLAVLLSVARLTETLRRPFTRSIDKVEIGRQDSDRWLTATELMIAAAQEHHFAEPIFHVHYLDLIQDPVGTVAALYRHFGETLQPAVAARIGRLVEAKPNGGYRAHGSRLEDYGLDAALERERYTRYMAHFGIRPEPEARAAQPAKSAPVLASRRSAKPVE